MKYCFATCRFVGDGPSPRELRSGENHAIIVEASWFYNPPEPLSKECPDPAVDPGGYVSWLYSNLPRADGYVIYLPKTGFKQALEAIKPLSARVIGLVMCLCQASLRARILEEASLDQHVLTADADCGDHYTMKLLLDDFLKTGRVRPLS